MYISFLVATLKEKETGDINVNNIFNPVYLKYIILTCNQ